MGLEFLPFGRDFKRERSLKKMPSCQVAKPSYYCVKVWNYSHITVIEQGHYSNFY
jgi:hypothetical protein